MATTARRSLVIVLLLAAAVPPPHLADILAAQVPHLAVVASHKIPHARGLRRITSAVLPRVCQAIAPQISGSRRQPRVSRLYSSRTRSTRPLDRLAPPVALSPALVRLRC